jgi:hypothetical protein
LDRGYDPWGHGFTRHNLVLAARPGIGDFRQHCCLQPPDLGFRNRPDRHKYSLTEFGRSLQRSALRFYPKREKVRKSRLLSAVPNNPLVWGVVAALLVSALPLELHLKYTAIKLTLSYRLSLLARAAKRPSLECSLGWTFRGPRALRP